MSSQSYHIPVILPDMRKEESVRQIVDALEYLDAVANDIFNRISFRVGENRDQLIAINNRINVAQAKIDEIRRTSSKATKVSLYFLFLCLLHIKGFLFPKVSW